MTYSSLLSDAAGLAQPRPRLQARPGQAVWCIQSQVMPHLLLQRRIKAHGTSFNALFGEARFALAKSGLKDPASTTAGIAAQNNHCTEWVKLL